MTPSSDAKSPLWYLDSSTALAITLGANRPAASWYEQCCERGDRFTSSRLLELEMVRVLRRESLDPAIARQFTNELTLTRVDDDLIDEAAALRPHVKALDALHLATANRIGAAIVTIVTHDANMARTAEQLGFDVLDPVA